MTAIRVLHPAVITEICKVRASPSAVSRTLPCGRQLNRIKRDLFGPANPVEITKIFTEEMEKHQETASKKWGFDFRTGVPANSNSQYVWERVSFQESSFVPEMYTLTRAAHVRPEHIEPTSLDELMDERSERENVANISASTDNESCDESQDESPPAVAFKMPTADGMAEADATSAVRGQIKPNLRKRQPKITEYMKERKRLAQTPRKASPPAKRMRTSSGSSSGAVHSSTHASITSHFSLRSSFPRQQN